MASEPAVLILHDADNRIIDKPHIIQLRLPPWPRRLLNWVLRRPDTTEAPDPIKWAGLGKGAAGGWLILFDGTVQRYDAGARVIPITGSAERFGDSTERDGE